MKSTKSLKAKQREIYHARVKKLQRAGLLGPVDFRKKATPAIVRTLEKYNSVISGKAATVQAGSAKDAARLRKTLGLKGSGKTIVIPREKGERFSFQKSTGEITSKRKGYVEGERIKKTLSKSFPAQPPTGSNKRLYYTIPERTRGAGKLKRKTFSSFNEMLYYLSKYDVNFEDIEDRIEVEEIIVDSRVDKVRMEKIRKDRAAASSRLKRKRRKETNRKAASQKKPRVKR
jgi:hypothetical protein